MYRDWTEGHVADLDLLLFCSDSSLLCDAPLPPQASSALAAAEMSPVKGSNAVVLFPEVAEECEADVALSLPLLLASPPEPMFDASEEAAQTPEQVVSSTKQRSNKAAKKRKAERSKQLGLSVDY